MIGDREELLRLAYMKLMDAVELLQSIGEDLLADEAGDRGRQGWPCGARCCADLAAKQGAPGRGTPCKIIRGLATTLLCATRY
jgi:hypothetical protein